MVPRALDDDAQPLLALAQRRVAEHPVRGLVGEDEKARDPSRRVEHPRVGEGPPGVAGAPVGVEGPGQVDEALGAPLHRRVDDRLGLGPAVGPDPVEALAHRPGQAGAEQREVGVVEEEVQVRAPGQDHALRGVEHEAERRAELRRPGLGGPERMAGPVPRADHARGLAAAGQEGERIALVIGLAIAFGIDLGIAHAPARLRRPVAERVLGALQCLELGLIGLVTNQGRAGRLPSGPDGPRVCHRRARAQTASGHASGSRARAAAGRPRPNSGAPEPPGALAGLASARLSTIGQSGRPSPWQREASSVSVRLIA